MDKNEAVRIITTCSKLYKNNLENKNLIFIFRDKQNNNCISHIETEFIGNYFYHLVGVEPINSNLTRPMIFYARCLDHKLSIDDFNFKSDLTTEKKLIILPQLMQIHQSATMINNSIYSPSNGSKIYCDKMAGSTTACLGFIADKGYFVPNTSLNEDIRDINKSSCPVLAILTKGQKDILYSSISKLAKNNTLASLNLPKVIRNKIDFENLQENYNYKLKY